MSDVIAILEALRPLITELAVVLLSPLLAAWLLKAQRRAGLDVEARHRDALHSAAITASRHLLSGERRPEELMADAVAYVRRSVPDAVAALKAPDSVIRKIIDAKAADLALLPLTVEGELEAKA